MSKDLERKVRRLGPRGLLRQLRMEREHSRAGLCGLASVPTDDCDGLARSNVAKVKRFPITHVLLSPAARQVHEAMNRMAEERELQQQQQQKQSEAAPLTSTPAAGPARQSSLAAAEALGLGGATTSTVTTAFLPPARPLGAAPVTASLAPATQARDSQQQPQPQQRQAPRYGLVGNS